MSSDACYICGANEAKGEHCDTAIHQEYKKMTEEERHNHRKKMEKKVNP